MFLLVFFSLFIICSFLKRFFFAMSWLRDWSLLCCRHRVDASPVTHFHVRAPNRGLLFNRIDFFSINLDNCVGVAHRAFVRRLFVSGDDTRKVVRDSIIGTAVSEIDRHRFPRFRLCNVEILLFDLYWFFFYYFVFGPFLSADLGIENAECPKVKLLPFVKQQ